MPCCGGRRRRCARAASVLLGHVNLLLMLFSGAALATAARLKWDPSAYIPLREALPLEYRITCALLLAFALALLALAHAAAAALSARAASRPRRVTLCTYAVLMSLLMVVELGAAVWVACRVLAYMESPAAQQLLELMEVRDHLRAAMHILARWYPLPERFNDLIEEAMVDGPRNAHVAEGAAAALLALQAAAVLLAALAAAPPAARPVSRRASRATLDTSVSAASDDQRARYDYHSEAEKNGVLEKAPLRTAYRSGRLVIL